MAEVRSLAAWLWQAIVCLLLLVPTTPQIVTETKPEAPIVGCEEDEPCWDWRTMGNRCGRDSLTEPVRCFDENGEEMRP